MQTHCARDTVEEGVPTEDRDASQQRTNPTVTGTIHIYVENYQPKTDALAPATIFMPVNARRVKIKTSAARETVSTTTVN